MRLVFLDIDGVLNREFPRGRPTRKDVERLDSQAVNNLMDVVDDVRGLTGDDVAIVLSSSWRNAGDLEHLRKLFQRTPFAVYLIDKTPALNYIYRPAEILVWLYHNVEKYNVENFVILDDYPEGLDLFGDRFVRINPNSLLTSQDARRAVEVLTENDGPIRVENLDKYPLDLSGYQLYAPEYNDCTLL